jgi:hypothetical protein
MSDPHGATSTMMPGPDPLTTTLTGTLGLIPFARRARRRISAWAGLHATAFNERRVVMAKTADGSR